MPIKLRLVALILALTSCSSDSSLQNSVEAKTNGKIAFQSQSLSDNIRDAIYIINSDGTEMTVLTEGDSDSELSPQWSPDGKRIVFASGIIDATKWLNELRISVMNIDGSKRVKLTSTPDVEDSDPSFSPDGKQILFTRMFIDKSSEVFIIDSDGSDERKIVDGRLPRWSPNGEEIVFLKDKDIYLMTLGEKEIQKLFTIGPATITTLAWSPNGRYLLFDRISSENQSNDGVYIYEFETKKQVRLIDSGESYCQDGAWSPDSKEIVLACSNGGYLQLYKMGLTSLNLTSLTSSREFPSYSPSWGVAK
jgi:Tol biopolymer transport system component